MVTKNIILTAKQGTTTCRWTMAHRKMEWQWEVIKQIWADKIMTISTDVLELF
jgi:hypothetical protein